MLALDIAARYRDLLINARCEATEHIVELQITLRPLLDVKHAGGHAAYSLARLLKLNDSRMTSHSGKLSEPILRRLESGMLYQLDCRSSLAGLADQFDRLLEAIRSPYCMLSVLKLGACDWPKGRSVVELLDALSSRGIGLSYLSIGDIPQLGGSLCGADHFFRSCDKLETLSLYNLGLTGELPLAIEALTSLKLLVLHSNSFEGTLPAKLRSNVKQIILSRTPKEGGTSGLVDADGQPLVVSD